MRDSKTIFWIEMTLSNDEYSTDEELVQYFMQEGGLTMQEAEEWVTKRQIYLNNIVNGPASLAAHKRDNAKGGRGVEHELSSTICQKEGE